MIIIRYVEWGAREKNWEEKLRELVVAHRFEQNETRPVPELQERETVIQGAEAISAYLQQLEKDINDWREPRCGV